MHQSRHALISKLLGQIGERNVKQRTLGNIRLISHLYKMEVVNEKILHYCIQDMLGDGKSDPVEDNVEVIAYLVVAAEPLQALDVYLG